MSLKRSITSTVSEELNQHLYGCSKCCPVWSHLPKSPDFFRFPNHMSIACIESSSLVEMSSDSKASDDMNHKNLFTYVLSPFGLTLENKTFEYCFTGIAGSVFGLLFIITFLSLFVSNDSLISIVFKVSIFLGVLCLFWSYHHMRQIQEKLIGMYDEISHWEDKRYVKSPFTPPLIAFVIAFTTSVSLMFLNFIYNDIYYEMFSHPLLSNVFYKQIFIFTFLSIYWIFCLQFINLEVLYKYTRLLTHYNKFIAMKRRIRPNPTTRAIIKQTLAKFSVNDSDLKATVHMMNKITSLQILACNMAVISNIIMNMIYISIQSSLLLCIFVIIFDIPYAMIQIFFWKKNSVQTSVINNLIQWRDQYPLRKVIVC